MPSPLEQLSAGALGWLGRNLDHFDPFSTSARAATHGKAKAALELALLCHCAARTEHVAARTERVSAHTEASAARAEDMAARTEATEARAEDMAARTEATEARAEDMAARTADVPEALSGATALVRKLWQDPDFPRLFDDTPAYASTYRLVYAALAPEGIDGTHVRGALTRLDPDFLSPHGKSPYRRVEIRYYADKAGVHHGMEPYAELLSRSPLVALRAGGPNGATSEGATPEGTPPREGTPAREAAPLTTPEAYALTHTGFYLGDFGRAAPGPAGAALAHARDLVRRMLRHCVEHDRWDLAAELVLTQFILGSDPLRTPSGAAAVECLVRAQRPDGAIPGRSAALTANPSASAGEFFRRAYHTTLVTALMAQIVSSPRPS